MVEKDCGMPEEEVVNNQVPWEVRDSWLVYSVLVVTAIGVDHVLQESAWFASVSREHSLKLPDYEKPRT